ncbi:MAG: DegV family protein [Eubacteriales bacterium]|nr:DegV family protein [Eubacteriales bacterium]
MSYGIVVDSSCELPKELQNDPRIRTVPFGLQVGNWHVRDDENFDQAEFLKRVAEYDGVAKSACPSPDGFTEAYRMEFDDIYVVTISSHLSGCYNSAVLGKTLYEEKYGEKNIHVFDSESASGGETNVMLKVMEEADKGIPFDEVVRAVEAFRDEMKTYFVLDNLDTLKKNGRLTGVKALLASTLSIKPVMGSHKGEIVMKGQAIGIKKALLRMAEHAAAEIRNPAEKCLVITHCNCSERAEQVRQYLEAKVSFRKVIIMDTRGLSSLYANDGGVIVTA